MSPHQSLLVIQAPPGREGERRYLLDVVFREWLGLGFLLHREEREDIRITLAGRETGSSVLIPDALLAIESNEWPTAALIPRAPLRTVATEAFPASTESGLPFEGLPSRASLPVLFDGRERRSHAIRPTDQGLALTFDLLGGIFFMITRYEEVITRSRDRLGRYPAADSVAARGGFHSRALVDEYVDLLWCVLHTVWPQLVRRRSSFELRLTHDVDQPWATWRQPIRRILRSAGADIARRRRADLAARRLWAAIPPASQRLAHDPFDTFDTLMAASERLGKRATFFFLAGNLPGEPDFRYQIDDPPVLQLIRRVKERGHEIGLHASLDSFRSPERIDLEFRALRDASARVGVEQDRWGVRQHYLRFENPHTWRAQERAGLDYDSTLGYPELPGFRAGTCHEYPTFDLLSGRAMRLREQPLLVMDVTLLEYMRLTGDRFWEQVRDVVRTCRRHNGSAILLVHNNSLPVFGLDHGFAERIADLATLE